MTKFTTHFLHIRFPPKPDLFKTAAKYFIQDIPIDNVSLESTSYETFIIPNNNIIYKSKLFMDVKKFVIVRQ